MAAASQEAYCTLLMSDAYLPGAMVLAHSLRDSGTKKQLAVLVTLDSLSVTTLEELKKIYDHIIPVDRISNKSPANLYLMNRPDLASTFTKIALWRQTQFDHIVYIDADIVALRAPDELFNDAPAFAACPDIGWPDCFNSGVLSLSPNMGDYYALLALAERGISFDGADQGLLNMHFRDWSRLSFAYNCTPSGSYQYVPAYRHFQSSISMVHYIGNDKPWIIGRENKGASGVYEELLGRWWAVYDKHYRVPTTENISGQGAKQSRIVQRYVKGEATSTDYGFSSVGLMADELEEPEIPIQTTEPSLTDKIEPAESLQKGETGPTPTPQVRRFSVDWDPIHQAPPANSRPEAANFPDEQYNMSTDPRLFQAPKVPEPPRGMYYEVPSTPSTFERPRPIFPWEATAPKPTRVFAHDAPPAPSESTPPVTTDDDDDQTETASPTTPTGPSIASIPYQRTNAWDEVPEIERYISNLPQNRRAKVQVLLSNVTNQSNSEAVSSPGLEDGPPGRDRRPSMKLTDFPTEFERPSLPVTPAPVRRPSFWGAERNAAGELPGAEGVPEQSDWDPIAKLQELSRKQSEVLSQGPTSSEPVRSIPDRDLPGSASMPMSDVKDETEGTDEGPQSSRADPAMPTSFQTVDYSRGYPAEEERGRTAEVAPTES